MSEENSSRCARPYSDRCFLGWLLRKGMDRSVVVHTVYVWNQEGIQMNSFSSKSYGTGVWPGMWILGMDQDVNSWRCKDRRYRSEVWFWGTGCDVDSSFGSQYPNAATGQDIRQRTCTFARAPNFQPELSGGDGHLGIRWIINRHGWQTDANAAKSWWQLKKGNDNLPKISQQQIWLYLCILPPSWCAICSRSYTTK